MKRTNRWAAIAVALIITGGVFAVPMAAQASEEGRRNTALGLGALAAGLLLTQHNKTPGIIAGVGAAIAYGQYQKKVDERNRWDRYGYDNRYDSGYGYDNGYRYGDDRYRQDRYHQDRNDWDRDRGRQDRDDRSHDNRRSNDDRHGWGHRG